MVGGEGGGAGVRRASAAGAAGRGRAAADGGRAEAMRWKRCVAQIDAASSCLAFLVVEGGGTGHRRGGGQPVGRRGLEPPRGRGRRRQFEGEARVGHPRLPHGVVKEVVDAGRQPARGQRVSNAFYSWHAPQPRRLRASRAKAYQASMSRKKKPQGGKKTFATGATCRCRTLINSNDATGTAPDTRRGWKTRARPCRRAKTGTLHGP